MRAPLCPLCPTGAGCSFGYPSPLQTPECLHCPRRTFAPPPPPPQGRTPAVKPRAAQRAVLPGILSVMWCVLRVNGSLEGSVEGTPVPAHRLSPAVVRRRGPWPWGIGAHQTIGCGAAQALQSPDPRPPNPPNRASAMRAAPQTWAVTRRCLSAPALQGFRVPPSSSLPPSHLLTNGGGGGV